MRNRSIIALIDLGRAFGRFAGRRILLGGGLMIAGATLEGVSLALLVPLIALLTGRHGGRLAAAMDHAHALGITTDGARLAFVLVLFVAAMTARATMLAARDRVLAELQLDFIDRQRTRLVEALAASRWQDIAGLRHARVTHALGSEIPRTATALNLLLTIATAAVMLLAQWLLVLLLSPELALLAIVLMALAVLGSLPIMRAAGDLGHALKGGGLAMLDAAGQLMGGLKLALAQNLQAAFVAEFRETIDDLAARQRSFVRRQGQMRIVGAVVASVALAAAVLAGRWLALPLATLVASLAVLARMFGPATSILRSAQQLAGVLPSSAGLADLRRELERSPIRSATAASITGGAIRFDGVCYSHARGGAPAGIRDLTVTIAPGEIVGVTGASGAGKTSFIDLLCGLTVPDQGTIRVGGTPLDSSQLPRWRDRIAYVAQDTYLFHGTIRRNLSWGLAALDEGALWRVLDMVGAAGIVHRLDNGLDAIVGERGTRLSGGERQRLALARAILRVPDLLILDEATNALDLAAERQILDCITSLAQRPTIILVSHRAEALRICNRILTFEAGHMLADRPAEIGDDSARAKSGQ